MYDSYLKKIDCVINSFVVCHITLFSPHFHICLQKFVYIKCHILELTKDSPYLTLMGQL